MSEESNIPSISIRMHGVTQAKFADELEKIVIAIRQGRLAYLDGGLLIQTVGNKLHIAGEVNFLVIS